MKPSRRNHNRMLTGAVIGISVIGILYFGYRAVSENSKAINENPFEYNYDTFKKIDPALLKYSEISRISLDMQKVSGIAVASDYTMYVTGDETVVIMDADGHVLSSVKTGETAHCLDVDFNGDMYCAMNDHIEVYDREGNQKARWESPGEGALTASIAVSEEHVYLADAGNRIVWKYDKSGNVVSRIGERDEDKDIPGFIVPSPYFDVDIDPDGFLWVVNPGRHTLENYTPEGDLRSS